MENPFRYGITATGVYFTDRQVELDELERDIRVGQNVVIISPRRYGKTSLVFRAIEDLKPEGVLIAYLDLFSCPTKDRFADHLATAIYHGVVAPIERVWQQAVDAFQKLPVRPKITINSDGTPSFEFTARDQSRDIDQTIEELLTMPGRIAEGRKRRVALILDEFQEVVTLDPQLPALMRSVFQHQGEVALIFLGSRRHLMQRVFTDVNEPMYRLAKPLPLREIPADDFRAFIRSRFEASGQEVTHEAIDRILTITDQHPHDTQELAYFTWSIAQADGTPATSAAVNRALDKVVDAENAHYTTLWDALSSHQRLVLTALAISTGEAVYSEEFRRDNRLGAASSVQRSLGPSHRS